MIKITHDLDSRKFKWLWAKYVVGNNLKYHCTNSLRGKYSKKFSKHNPNFNSQKEITFDESSELKAIYICGVSSKGYAKKENYPFNLHLVLIPEAGNRVRHEFLDWSFEIENARISEIIDEKDLPKEFVHLPPEYTTCRIFRWACTEGELLTAAARQ